MGDSWLTKEQLKVLRRANEDEGFRLPIPTQVISDGEIFPPPQSKQQAMVEALLKERAGVLGKQHGLNRRQFLRTASGMAAAFLAMNDVYGKVFTVDQAEAADFEAAGARLAALRDQFIFDAHTHHVHDDYTWEGQLFLLQYSRGDQEAGLPSWTGELEGRELDLKYFKFPHYVKDIFFDSETDVTILSNSPSVVPEKQLLTEDQLVASRNYINGMARTKRVYAHGTIWPSNQPFLDDMDRQAEELKIDSWKGYTIGDPLGLVPEANFPWRLDDEKVTYPAYEKAMKYGIKNLCIHKGLLPVDWKSFDNWPYAAVDDVVKAAKDWPELNFIIYHSGFRAFMDVRQFAEEFEQSGKIPWVDDLAEIPKKHGLTNVYGEIGLSFASCVTTYPRVAAAMLGRLIQGMGADHVIWGTDSIWFGSPQWQIDAFRRLDMPMDLQEKFGFAPLGPADSEVKKAILGYNSARMYGLGLTADGRPVEAFEKDRLARLRNDYLAAGGMRDNIYWGWIHQQDRAPA